MYVEFELPTDGSYGYVLDDLKLAIAQWAGRQGVPQSMYSEKTIKYTHRLGFNKELYFSLFSMTWNEKHKFKIVNIANERY